MKATLFPDLIVNGELVPHALVAAETQNHDAPAGKPGLAWRKAANAMAIRTLLLQEARARQIEADCQEVEPGRFETEEEARIRALMEDAVAGETPRDMDVRAEWRKDPSRFRTPPLWEVSHILCAGDPRDEALCAKAHQRAVAVLSAVQKAPKGFGSIAARESDCGSKSVGGALGQLGPGDTVPEFESALKTLGEGDVCSAPVLTRFGYHVIRLDALAEGEVLPFVAVRAKIARAMEKAAWVRNSREFINGLIRDAEIEGAELAAL